MNMTQILNAAKLASDSGKSTKKAEAGRKNGEDFFSLMKNISSEARTAKAENAYSVYNAKDIDDSEGVFDLNDSELIDEETINRILGGGTEKTADAESVKQTEKTEQTETNVEVSSFIKQDGEGNVLIDLEGLLNAFGISPEAAAFIINSLTARFNTAENSENGVGVTSQTLNLIPLEVVEQDFTLNAAEPLKINTADMRKFAENLLALMKDTQAEVSENDSSDFKGLENFINEVIASVPQLASGELPKEMLLRIKSPVMPVVEDRPSLFTAQEKDPNIIVTEKIIEHIGKATDTEIDFEILSLEKGADEKPANDIQTLLRGMQKTTAHNLQIAQMPETESAGEIQTVQATTEEVEPLKAIQTSQEGIQTAQTEEEIEPSETVHTISASAAAVSNEAIETEAEIPELVTHYTRAAQNIAKLIANNRSGENFQVKMLLRPEGMGEMLVSVTYSKGNINLNIATDSTMAQRELISQSAELRNTLSGHNFNLMNFDVGNKNPNDRNQQEYQGRQNSGNRRNGLSEIHSAESVGESPARLSSAEITQLRNMYLNRRVVRNV